MHQQRTQGKKLFAIYKKGNHLGNVREKNSDAAIISYLLDSGYSKNDIQELDLMVSYKTSIAKYNVHY
jgi:hypothetical protein